MKENKSMSKYNSASYRESVRNEQIATGNLGYTAERVGEARRAEYSRQTGKYPGAASSDWYWPEHNPYWNRRY